MQTFEIPHEAWLHRLNEFTTIHEGRLVSLDVPAPEIGAQSEIDNLPLLGVSADRVDHDAVTRMYVERTDEGADAAPQTSRSTARKRSCDFAAAALPETMDGVVHR